MRKLFLMLLNYVNFNVTKNSAYYRHRRDTTKMSDFHERQKVTDSNYVNY